jgi:hypothetical protein
VVSNPMQYAGRDVSKCSVNYPPLCFGYFVLKLKIEALIIGFKMIWLIGMICRLFMQHFHENLSPTSDLKLKLS